MISILKPVSPKDCELIAHGDKRAIVSKVTPKEVPFKGYLYCTKDKHLQLVLGEDNWYRLYDVRDYREVCGGHINFVPNGNGKVIGEFICNQVDKLEEQVISSGLYYSKYEDVIDYELNEETCLDNFELLDYGQGKTLYVWHISDLKLYNQPKELTDFRKPMLPLGLSWDNNKIMRPPITLCYVQDLEK